MNSIAVMVTMMPLLKPIHDLLISNSIDGTPQDEFDWIEVGLLLRKR